MPILVTLFGIVTLVKLVQPSNAESMLVTLNVYPSYQTDSDIVVFSGVPE